MSRKPLFLSVLVLLLLTLAACQDKQAPIFQVEMPFEVTGAVDETLFADVHLITAGDVEELGITAQYVNYQMQASVDPVDGPVEMVRLGEAQGDAQSNSISTTLDKIGDVSIVLQVHCLEAGQAEVTVRAQTTELVDEATMQVTCEASSEAGQPIDDGQSASDCEPYDSDKNEGSMSEVGHAAFDTGLVPEGVDVFALGAELKRMAEATGEVCQSDLLALTSGETPSPDLEAAIAIAVERVQEGGE